MRTFYAGTPIFLLIFPHFNNSLQLWGIGGIAAEASEGYPKYSCWQLQLFLFGSAVCTPSGLGPFQVLCRAGQGECVTSPGLLLPGITVESMRPASRLCNPSVARIFREAGIMEQWGTGLQRVFE